MHCICNFLINQFFGLKFRMRVDGLVKKFTWMEKLMQIPVFQLLEEDTRTCNYEEGTTLPWSVLSASPTLVIKVFCPCTDTNFAKRFLTACHAFLRLPFLFQITKCRFRWVFGRSVLHGAPQKVGKRLCTPEMLQILYT